MKFVFYIVLVASSFFFGKMMYGTLVPTLLGTAVASEEAKTVFEVQVKSSLGTVNEKVDLNELVPDDFPEKVLLSQSLTLVDADGQSPLTLEPGSPVTPLSLEGVFLKVTSPLASHLTGEIAVDDTDFVSGVAKLRMDRRIAGMNNQATPEPVAPPVTTPEVKPEPEPAKEVAEATPDEMAKEKVRPEPTPDPEPSGQSASGMSLPPEDLIAEMKASLEGGEIKGLDIAKVKNWEAGADETFDGSNFQVGIVTYQEMTILGEKMLQAKALFKGGKLVKWIHSKTGMEIR